MNSHYRRVKAAVLSNLDMAASCATDAEHILRSQGFESDALDSIRRAKNALTEAEERFHTILNSRADDREALMLAGGVPFSPAKPCGGQA